MPPFERPCPGYSQDQVEPLVNITYAAVVPLGSNKHGLATRCLKADGLILLVRFEKSRNFWKPKREVEDFHSNEIEVIFDVPFKVPENASNESSCSFAFLLMGQYWTQGMTVSSTQAVCLLLEESKISRGTHTRIGLVKGAGSIVVGLSGTPEELPGWGCNCSSLEDSV
jgi:hypothetical protein